MSQVTFSPNLTPYNPVTLLSHIQNTPYQTAGAVGLFAYALNSKSWLGYIGSALLTIKSAIDWINQPHFHMPSHVPFSTLNEGSQKLYDDMVNCSLKGRNRAIAMQRYT